MRQMISTLLIVLFPSMGHSIPFNSALSDFSPYDGVKFILADEVSGGCFTNLAVVEDYAKSKIALSGMELTEQDDFRYQFIVQAIGRNVNGYCQGQITVGLYSHIDLWTGEKGLVTIKEIGYTFRDKSFNDVVLDQIGRFFKK